MKKKDMQINKKMIKQRKGANETHKQQIATWCNWQNEIKKWNKRSADNQYVENVAWSMMQLCKYKVGRDV